GLELHRATESRRNPARQQSRRIAEESLFIQRANAIPQRRVLALGIATPPHILLQQLGKEAREHRDELRVEIAEILGAELLEIAGVHGSEREPAEQRADGPGKPDAEGH